MNAIMLLVNAFLPLALTELQALTGLSPNIATLIQGIDAAGTQFLTLYKSGQGNTVTATSILTAVQAAITILQSQKEIDPKALAISSALAKMIQAGIDANNNLTEVDPNALQPIQPLQ